MLNELELLTGESDVKVLSLLLLRANIEYVIRQVHIEC